MELRRHQVALGDAVLADEVEHLAGSHLSMEDDRVADLDRRAREVRARGVVERRAADVHVAVVLLHAEHAEEPAENSGRNSGSTPGARRTPLGRPVVPDV